MFVYKTWKRSFLSVSRFDTWLVVDRILDNSIRVFNPNPTSPGRVDTRVYLNPTFSDFWANFVQIFKVYKWSIFNWIMYLLTRELDFFLPKLFHTRLFATRSTTIPDSSTGPIILKLTVLKVMEPNCFLVLTIQGLCRGAFRLDFDTFWTILGIETAGHKI